MDDDLNQMTREQLVVEAKKLRDGIREHRDSDRHNLCWHHPKLWGLLPEKTDPIPQVPDWPEFMEGCIKYRQSLDTQLASAERIKESYDSENQGRPFSRRSADKKIERVWRAYDPAWLVKLAKEQLSVEPWLPAALEKCTQVSDDIPYLYFVDPENANQPGAAFQYERSLMLKDPQQGALVLDVLKDGGIGGVEFLEKI